MPVEFPPRISEIRSKVASGLIEKLVPPIKLERRGGATLELARRMDSEKGNYLEAAQVYASVMETSLDNKEKLEALFGLSQQLINLGRFGQAKRLLQGDVYSSFYGGEMEDRDRRYYLARRQEKLGWIADYEGDYVGASNYFDLARRLLVGEEGLVWRLNKEEKSVLATAIHFLGRANFKLERYPAAIENFEEHLKIKGLNEDEYGFSHGWLARCYMAMGKMGEAEGEIGMTKASFVGHLETHPEKGSLAHYYLLGGEFEARKGEFRYAEGKFSEALRIFYEKERYPKGEAAAPFGIAGCNWAERNYGGAFVYAVRGVITYPLSIIKL